VRARVGGSASLRRLEQLVPRAELHPRAAELLAGGSLVVVDRRPARVHDETRHAAREEAVDLLESDVLARSIAQVFEQQPNRFRCVLLVGADDAARAPLDPPRRIDAGPDAAAVVRHRSRPLVERDARKLDAAVPDAAEDDAGLERLTFV